MPNDRSTGIAAICVPVEGRGERCAMALPREHLARAFAEKRFVQVAM
jgi:hypothetical protein